MFECKNIKGKKYKGTEPSPKGLGYCASGEKVGNKMKGRDKNTWIVKKVSNGSKRWFKYNIDTKDKDKDKTKTKTKINTGKYLDNKNVDTKKIVEYISGYNSIYGLKIDKNYIHKLVDYNKIESNKTKIDKSWKKTRKFDSKSVFDVNKKILQKNKKR